MKVLGLGALSGLKQIASDQVTQWAFGKIFVTIGLPKRIVADSDDFFMECSRKLSNIPYSSRYMHFQVATTRQL